MGILTDSGAHLVLNNRYALLNCIAVSGVGKIYRGRDLKQVKHQGLESRILIHMLPNEASDWALDAVFQQITLSSQRLSLPWILKPLAYGHDNAQPYVVLESPNTWEVQSFLTQAAQSSACQRNATKALKPLIKQRYLDKHTDPALLLCVADTEVYLLATALSPQVQQLEKRGTHRVIPRKPLSHALMTGSLLSLFGAFTAVAGNAVLETVIAPKPVVSSAAAMHEAPTLPTHSDAFNVKHELQAQRDPQLVEVINLTADLPKPKSSSKPKSEAKPQPQRKPPVAVTVTKNKKSPVMATPLVAPPPVPASAAPQPVKAVNNTDLDSLIAQAYAAMNAGNLGQNGALHFTRKLRSAAPQHPQVARLAQEITAAYLRQVRAALIQNVADAERILPLSRQLIQEFGLTHLERAQSALENKVAQLRQ